MFMNFLNTFIIKNNYEGLLANVNYPSEIIGTTRAHIAEYLERYIKYKKIIASKIRIFFSTRIKKILN
jgi:hypothetical protein